jgi:hypothetical protein
VLLAAKVKLFACGPRGGDAPAAGKMAWRRQEAPRRLLAARRVAHADIRRDDDIRRARVYLLMRQLDRESRSAMAGVVVDRWRRRRRGGRDAEC